MIIMLAAVALTPLFFGLCFLTDGPAPLLAPLTIFLTGLCFVLYSRTFRDDHPAPDRFQPYQVANPRNNPLLSLPERPSRKNTRATRTRSQTSAAGPICWSHTDATHSASDGAGPRST